MTAVDMLAVMDRGITVVADYTHGEFPQTACEMREARAAMADLIAERDRLASIVSSHEAQIARMTAEQARLTKAAGKLVDSQGGPWERGNAYISARGAENMNAAMKETRAAIAGVGGAA